MTTTSSDRIGHNGVVTLDHLSERLGPDELCPHGCYWECEHRTSGERLRLRAVTDDAGRMLRRCRECREFFYDAVAHGREHERMRQLGWLPERYPAGWSNRGWRWR
jgi:hypothetical protein